MIARAVEYHGRITKQGSRLLRWVMVEAARVAVNNDARLSEFYERVGARMCVPKFSFSTAVGSGSVF